MNELDLKIANDSLKEIIAPSAPAQPSLFRLPGFLDPQTCTRLMEEALTSPTTRAPVYLAGSSEHVHETVRKTTSFHPASETVSLIHEKLSEQKAALENHFGITLIDCEPPQFLHYRPGDFFIRHQDGNTEQLEFDHLRIRRISVVVFLNDSSTDALANTFSGGLLNFYSEYESSPANPPVVSLGGECGLLIAFTADTIHEVAPVTGGERFSIISWFR